MDDCNLIIDSMTAGTGPAQGRRTVFIACGMAVFDVAWGGEMLRRAEADDIGRVIDLWASTDVSRQAEGGSR